MINNYYVNCRLCPRNCGVDRSKTVGYCGEGDALKAARAGLHFFEEPYISGTEGSGTVFFTGCSLKCIYCQNYEITAGARNSDSKIGGARDDSGDSQTAGARDTRNSPQITAGARNSDSKIGGARDENGDFQTAGARNSDSKIAGARNSDSKIVDARDVNNDFQIGGARNSNFEIVGARKNFEITVERLAEIFLEQQARGANNINLVTGTHFTPQIAEAIKLSRSNGLTIPTLWNSSGYEKVETLKLLEGLIDIWLPDFKTLNPELAKKYMNAEDYPGAAKEALAFMVQENNKNISRYLYMKEQQSFRELQNNKKLEEGKEHQSLRELQNNKELQTAKETIIPAAVFKDDLMIKGVNVRHLVMPGSTKDSMKVIEYLYKTYGDKIYVSIMSQYTPLREFQYKELNRKLTKREYERVVDFAIDLGVTNAMIQEEDVAEASFIPKFDGEGI